MSKNSFCKKRKFTHSNNDTEHNLCQLYNIEVDFGNGHVSLMLEIYSQQRK